MDNESRLVCTFGPKGLEYIHPAFLDALVKRDVVPAPTEKKK